MDSNENCGRNIALWKFPAASAWSCVKKNFKIPYIFFKFVADISPPPPPQKKK